MRRFRFAVWLYRRWALPRVIGYLCEDRVKGDTTVYASDEITVVFRA